MTELQELDMLKHEAKIACRENGVKVFIKNIALLESGYTNGMPDYIMFRDLKTGLEYQCCASWKNYTSDHPSKWVVTVYGEPVTISLPDNVPGMVIEPPVLPEVVIPEDFDI